MYHVTKNEVGLSTLLTSSLDNAALGNENVKEILFKNILLAGGTTMMAGLDKRIAKDLKTHLDQIDDFTYTEVIAQNNRYISKWIGMSMLASMSAFDKLFIEKAKLNEYGEDRAPIIAKIF